MKSDLISIRQKTYVADLLCNTLSSVSYCKMTGKITLFAHGSSARDLALALQELKREVSRATAHTEEKGHE